MSFQDLDLVEGTGLGDMLISTYDPANKNGQLAADNEVVHLSTTETITGNKIFEGVQTFNEIQFDTTPTASLPAQGKLFWNTEDKTLSLCVDADNDVNLDFGQEFYIRVVNKTGVQINNGQIVYVSVPQGNRPTAKLAKADAYSTSKVIGVATQDIANNEEGLITTFGIVREINTSGFSTGDTLYLSNATAGLLTKTAPTTGFLVKVGKALNSTNNGSIFVNVSQPISLDSTLAGNSNDYTPSEKAIKARFDGAQVFKGTTNDGSTNIVEYRDSDNNIVEKIDSDGFKSVRWRDEYASGRWTSAGGAAAPDEINVTIGGVRTRSYSFDGNNIEESMANGFELAHDLRYVDINSGALQIDIHHHVRPSSNNSGVAKLFFDWCYTSVGAAPIAMTSIPILFTIAANQQHYHLLEHSHLAIPAGGFGIGGVITFNVRRNPQDSEDTYPDDLLFIKTALHVPTDDRGSRTEYVK